MPSPPVLPVDPLLEPVPGDDPAGKRLSLLDRNKLTEYREDFDPERDLSEEERQSPQFAEKPRVVPQWDKVIQFGTQFLAKTGKDLVVAVAVVEGLTKKAKFAGLRDGLKLLTGLCERCWDRMHPVIDDPDDPDEVDGRVAPFAYIDDAVKMPFFPAAVRGLTLLETPDGQPISFLSCQSYEANRPPKVTQDAFRQAVAAAGPDAVARLRQTDEDITDTLAELRALAAALDAKVGSNAPGLGSLRKAVEDCQTMTREALRLRSDGGLAPAANDAPDRQSPATFAPAAGGVLAAPVRSRDEVYARLAELTDLLEKLDPHSPVPLLIRRAMEMRELKFPELVDRLNSDKRVLEFIRSPLGEQG